jgi:mRNA (guanine-N7-)-methyltransferase
MSDSSRVPPSLRRRSSVAYDPARDTFTEIPNSIPEQAITGSPKNQKEAKTTDSESNISKKRRRSNAEDDVASRAANKSPNPTSRDGPKALADLPRVPRRNQEEGELSSSRPTPSVYSRRPDGNRAPRNGTPQRRSRSPDRRPRNDAYSRRSPIRRRSPSPVQRSPPQQQARPGGRQGKGRNVLAEKERLEAEREARLNANANRGVQDASNQFYNARPEWVKERGRDWRKNESEIKGLRSYNNWVKSTLIQRFSPEEKVEEEELGWGEEAKVPEQQKPLLVLDIGCGKGGDLGKWQLAPQPVDLYVGLDPADTSIQQAQDRYNQMRRGRRPIFDARFVTKDCFGQWIGEVGIVREVGIDPNAGTGTISRFGGGGFDVVTMMFSMHYSFESEEKVKTMLRNVSGSLKKGGRFIGTVPNSDVLSDQVKEWFERNKASKPESNGSSDAQLSNSDGKSDDAPGWGNSIYSVRFPSDRKEDLVPDESGTVAFRPPTGWKYTYWMAEAVDVPEFVVPWEAFRAICESYNLEQRYRKPFLDIWDAERNNREMYDLAGRMNVIDRGSGQLTMSQEEKEAVGFYHAFCFVKV